MLRCCRPREPNWWAAPSHAHHLQQRTSRATPSSSSLLLFSSLFSVTQTISRSHTHTTPSSSLTRYVAFRGPPSGVEEGWLRRSKRSPFSPISSPHLPLTSNGALAKPPAPVPFPQTRYCGRAPPQVTKQHSKKERETRRDHEFLRSVCACARTPFRTMNPPSTPTPPLLWLPLVGFGRFEPTVHPLTGGRRLLFLSRRVFFGSDLWCIGSIDSRFCLLFR